MAALNLHPVQQHHLDLRRYLVPTDLEECLDLLDSLGERARIVAGGSDLLLELERGQRPGVDTLIDVSRLAGFDLIEDRDEHLWIGAGVTHTQAATSSLVREFALPLAQASWEVASPQLRNRATIAGNVVTASPANDTISALRAVGTEVELVSSRGRRAIDLARFHTGVRETVLEAGEIVTGFRVRKLSPESRGVFVKLGLRRAQAISVVHLAVVVELAEGLLKEARLALGSVAPTIVEAPEASEFLVGRTLDRTTIDEAARRAAASVNPIDDLRATGEYRRQVVEVMVKRALDSIATGPVDWRPPPVTLNRATPGTAPGPLDLGGDEEITAIVNGAPLSAGGAAGKTLMDWLRDDLGLTGTKEGCAEGECGACTVYLDGAAVMACLVPAGRAAGAEITTIEGLAGTDGLHPLQRAFVERGAVQCGFCIPGFLMSGAMLLEERHRPDRDEILTGLSGNLCRCTGYYMIIEAVEAAAR